MFEYLRHHRRDYPWLGYEFLGIEVMRWLTALVVALLVILAAAVIRRVLTAVLTRLARRTASGVDDVVVDTLNCTRWFFYAGLGLGVGGKSLGLDGTPSRIMGAIILFAVLAQIAIWIDCLLIGSTNLYVKNAENTGQAQTVASATKFVGRLVAWAVLLIFALSNLGIEVSALVAGLGIGGIAAALAVQNVLGDLIASISIYLDRPFDIGDFVVVSGTSGTVEKVGLRTTRIRALTGEQVVLANADIAKSKIQNYKRMTRRRIVMSVGVTYGTDAALLERIPDMIKEIIGGIEGLTCDRSHFQSFGDSALLFETVYWVESPDYNVYMDHQQAINLALYRRFTAEGLDFAFPTRTLHLIAAGPEHPTEEERTSAPNGRVAPTS